MNAKYSTETRDAPASEPSRYEPSPPPLERDAHQVAGRGFGQTWGLHPGITLLTLIADTMLFGQEGLAAAIGVPTGGLSLMLALIISGCGGAVIGAITYKAQQKWYGDDKESALIKACILAFLTAIPTPLPSFLYVPAGIVGFVHTWRKR